MKKILFALSAMTLLSVPTFAQQFFDPNDFNYQPTPAAQGTATDSQAASDLQIPAAKETQTGGSLFPELSGINLRQAEPAKKAQDTETVEEIFEEFDEEIIEEVGEETQPTDGEPVMPKKKQQESGELQLILDDVTIVNPSAGLQICSASLLLKNNTDQTINSIQMDVNYGPENPISASFGTTEPDQTNKSGMGMAGPGCNLLLTSEPEIVIKNCTIAYVDSTGKQKTRNAKDECQGKMKFVPIPDAQ